MVTKSAGCEEGNSRAEREGDSAEGLVPSGLGASLTAAASTGATKPAMPRRDKEPFSFPSSSSPRNIVEAFGLGTGVAFCDGEGDGDGDGFGE